jgi:hypothetical protein
MDSHIFDKNHDPETITNVSEHFNSQRHAIQNFSFMPIDKVTQPWKRL